MTKQPSKKLKTLTPSWQLVSKNLNLIRRYSEQIIVIALLPSLVLQLGRLMKAHNENIGLILISAGGLWALLSIGAMYTLQLAAVRDKNLSIAESYQRGWQYFWRLLGFFILFAVLLAVGLVLLIVPGLIIARRYLLTPLYIVDKDLPIRDAMNMSAKQTKPVARYVWGILGIELVFTIVGALIGIVFGFIPGIAIIASTLAGLGAYLLPALRYNEIVHLKTAK